MSIQALHFDAPTVEVVSDSPRLEMLMTRLKQNGLRPIRATAEPDPSLPVPLLIDGYVIPPEQMTKLLTRNRAGGKRILIGLGTPRGTSVEVDIYISEVTALDTLLPQLALRQRQISRQKELTLRNETYSGFLNQTALSALPDEQKSIFYVGGHGPEQIALRHACQIHGFDFKSFLTKRNLEDALLESSCTALIVDTRQIEPFTAAYLASLPYRPALQLISISSTEPSEALYAETDKVVVASVLNEAELSELLIEIDAQPQVPQPRHGISNEAFDKATGLYSRHFFETHLARQIRVANETAAPLSVVAIELEDHLRAPLISAARIKPFLRETDMAARLSARHILVSLTDTPYRGAVAFARRLQDRIESVTATRVLEKRRFHTAESLISALTIKSRPSLRRQA